MTAYWFFTVNSEVSSKITVHFFVDFICNNVQLSTVDLYFEMPTDASGYVERNAVRKTVLYVSHDRQAVTL